MGSLSTILLISIWLLAAVNAAAVDDPGYWLADIAHQGIAPFHPNPSAYKVFRNVKEYGAHGDGITDDTAAINAAISEGGRFGPATRQTSSSTPAIVYFPAGTYVVSSPIIDFYLTQLIGNPNALPTIKAGAGFKGSYLIDGDQYQGDGLQGWNSTNVFLRQIRNLNLDTTDLPPDLGVAALHWPVGQSTSIQNVHFALNSDPGTLHEGLFIENGSGGLIVDVTITGGLNGAKVGNQQFTTRNLTISKSVTCIYQIWNWGWTWQGLHLFECGTAFSMISGGLGRQQVGSVNIIDSVIENSAVFVDTAWMPSNWSNGSLILEKIRLSNVPVAVKSGQGTVALPGSAENMTITAWGQGHRYNPSGPNNFQGDLDPPSRPSVLLANGSSNYYARSKPQYETLPVSSFLSIRTAGAKGDGSTDDTLAIQSALNSTASPENNNNKILYFDQGIYKITSTLYIPPGSRIVGEAYPVLLAAGQLWSDINKPTPVVQVGKPGEHGRVEWSDMLISTQGSTPGAVLIEWNLQTEPEPDLAGSFGLGYGGMWEVHARIGGFTGSDLQVEQCPIGVDVVPACEAAYMAVHVTRHARGVYMENVWLWTADHDLDATTSDIRDVNGTRVSIYTGRGLLVEGENVWLYGTSVEHFALYQYQFAGAQSVVAGFIQTETPYYQPNPPPAQIPYQVNTTIHDPDYSITKNNSHKDEPEKPFALGLRILDTRDIFIYGAGLYSFFNDYDTSCSDFPREECQRRIFVVEGNNCSRVVVYSLNTVGVEEMISMGLEGEGDGIGSNSGGNLGEYGGIIAYFSLN